jgi:hypothetical protein
LIFDNLSNAEKTKIKTDLLDYCKLDTWAMVKIWEILMEHPEAIGRGV